MTSATDELRRLLDERGVGTYKHEAPAAVCLAFFDGKRWHDCWESVGGEVNVTFSLTPEQAVAATLGRGTCEVEYFDDGMDEGMDGHLFSYAPPTWHLSCGHEAYGSERPHYCPVCGRGVEP